MSNKQKYRTHCERESSIPVFSQAWWLDAVAGENGWDVVIIKNKSDEIIASLPYVLRKNKYGFKVIDQPPLTQHLGPWLKITSIKNSVRLSQEKDLLLELFSKLPRHDKYSQKWSCERTNWLPLYWKGYAQTTRYTYQIHNLEGIDVVFKNFDHSKRKNIKKAEKIVSVKFDITSEDFYNNHVYTLKKQGEVISYTYDLFKRIYDYGYEKNNAFTIGAYDIENNLQAALFIVKDSYSAYDLISTIDPDFRNSGAASLLVLEAIKHASNFVNIFDFEGSMIEGVERSFRSFGAVQTPYFAISKTNNKLLRKLEALKMVFK